MKNFLEVNHVDNVESMYGKEVYFTLSPKPNEYYVYKGKLISYGAYGIDGVYGIGPECKNFCVQVQRGDGCLFVDYVCDGCFVEKEKYEEFKQWKNKTQSYGYKADELSSLLAKEEGYLDVLVNVGGRIYPIVNVTVPPRSVKEPAIVLVADIESEYGWNMLD